MKLNGYLAASMLFALSACGPDRQPQAARNETPPPAPIAPSAPIPDANKSAPPETSLPEPKGPIDPTSVEAAGQVVQHYGALIEQKRFAKAAKLWGNAEAAAAFAKQLRPGIHLQIGELGESEGAAGSIYTTMPVVFYSDTLRRSADIILRRVNDVPGSTEEQRRWHIERIEWKDAG
jgi:hypothetical protein